MRLLVVLLLLVCVAFSKKYVPNRGPRNPVAPQFNGEWAVKVSPGADPKFLYNLGFTTVKPVANLKDYYTVSYGGVTAKSGTAHIKAVESLLLNTPEVTFAEKQYNKRMFSRVDIPTDPLFPDQWHLKNTGQNGGTAGQDVNVTGVWEMGYTGNGVRIAVVDDGYQYVHPDLAPGYVASSSYNFNDDTPDPNPTRYDSHGTAAAGVALARNNSACGVGSAFMAEGSGIRLISDYFSDAECASALSYMYQENDIYTNSWGPTDSGRIHEGPDPLTKLAMEDAITNGRGGLGSIYVWAAGNGLQSNDNCNFDGFVNSRFTIGVGAVDNNGVQSYYSEPCAAMLVTAPSSGNGVGITTTDLLGSQGYSSGNCTDDFGGTSSATPLVAGIIALMLEANPKLSWRDVQQVLVSTAVKNDPNDTDWSVNGAGYHINHKYGFGRVDAYGAVAAAESFVSLTPSFAVAQPEIVVNQTIPEGGPFMNATVNIQGYLKVEQVEVSVSIPDYWEAGDLEIYLISPSGTQSVLSEQHGQSTSLYAALPSHPEIEEFPAFIVEAPYGPYVHALNGTAVLAYTLENTTTCGKANITNCADLAGKIAVFDQADCWTSTQAYAVQECGAIVAMIIMAVEGEPDFDGWDDGPYELDVDIDTVMIDLGSGITLKYLLANENNSLPLNIAEFPGSINLTFNGWTFSTVRNWGESSDGVWTLQIADKQPGDQGVLLSWGLTLYGTAVCPTECTNGKICSGPNTCACPTGWSGDTCTTPVCSQGCLNGAVCTAPDVCNCTKGWTGDSCSTAICANECANGGVCAAPDQCNCTVGWSGATCESAVCSQGCSNGVCTFPNQCNCTSGWTGSSCASAVCAVSCGVNGACAAPNECRCFDGWEGTTCQNKRKIYKDYRAVGGVMGGIAGLALIAVGVLLYKRHKQRKDYVAL